MDRTKISSILLFIFVTFENVSSENIVVWQVLGTQSTRISMMPLMEELADRGHNVTILTIFPGMDKSSTKVKTIVPKKWLDVVGTSWDDSMGFFELRRKPWNIPKLWYDFLSLGYSACEAILTDEDFLSWATSTKTKVDMVLIESVGNDCAYGFIHYWKAKTVMYGTTTVSPFMPDAYGLADESSSIGDVSFGFPSSHKNPMSFWKRFLNAWHPIIYSLRREYVYLPMYEEVYRKTLDFKENELPRFVDIEKNTSVVLLTTHYSFGASRSFPPNVIPVGGAVVAKKQNPLPKDMEQFINSGKNGFIFVSFGTVTEFVNFDENVQKEFIAALAELPDMKFVWKSSKTINHTLPDNVFVAKWAPQQTLLAHPKIKAFISHVGMGSTTEAIHYGVPLICLPVLMDQDLNAGTVSDRGAGIKLEILTLKREELYWAVKEILNNPKYREGMKRLSQIFSDRPRSPVEEAVWWVEYALRHDNIHEILMPPSAHQTWWVRRQIDVWLTSTLLLLLIIIVPLYIIRITVKKLLLSSKDSGKKKLKKN